MPFEDDFVEVIRLLGVETAQGEVIDDEDVGREQAAEDLVGGVVGPRLVQILQEVVGPQEEDVAPGPACRVAERASEKGLPDTDGTEEDDVLLTLDEAEAEEVADAIAVEGDGRVPVEAFQGLLLLEAGAVEAQREIRVIPPVDLVLEDELEEVELSELRLLRVGDPIRQRREHARELQALEHRLEGLGDFHLARSPFGDGRSFPRDAGSA